MPYLDVPHVPAISCQQGRGHVSVNTSYGCGLACPFCIGRADPWTRDGSFGPRVIASTHRILDSLSRHRESLQHLKLSLLDYIDPFEHGFNRTLFELLRGIELRLPGQAVMITSRFHPGNDVVEQLGSFTDLRLSICVSLGDAAGGVRPVTPVEDRLNLLSCCTKAGLHTVALFKPMVREWTSPEGLLALLKAINGRCTEMVLGGLRISPEVEASLRASGWPVPLCPSDPAGGVEPSFRTELVALATRACPDLPISEHRTCAVNRHFSLACRTAASSGALETLERSSEPPRACKYPPCRNVHAHGFDAAGYCLLRQAA